MFRTRVRCSVLTESGCFHTRCVSVEFRVERSSWKTRLMLKRDVLNLRRVGCGKSGGGCGHCSWFRVHGLWFERDSPRVKPRALLHQLRFPPARRGREAGRAERRMVTVMSRNPLSPLLRSMTCLEYPWRVREGAPSQTHHATQLGPRAARLRQFGPHAGAVVGKTIRV